MNLKLLSLPLNFTLSDQPLLDHRLFITIDNETVFFEMNSQYHADKGYISVMSSIDTDDDQEYFLNKDYPNRDSIFIDLSELMPPFIKSAINSHMMMVKEKLSHELHSNELDRITRFTNEMHELVKNLNIEKISNIQCRRFFNEWKTIKFQHHLSLDLKEKNKISKAKI